MSKTNAALVKVNNWQDALAAAIVNATEADAQLIGRCYLEERAER
jgi:hypothetical protein